MRGGTREGDEDTIIGGEQYLASRFGGGVR